MPHSISMLIAAPAEIGAALEFLREVCAGDLCELLALLEDIELDPGLVAAEAHRHVAFLLFERSERRHDRERKPKLLHFARQLGLARQLAGEQHVHFDRHGRARQVSDT